VARNSCEREAETIRAAWGVAGPAALDARTAAHVAECPHCAEIAELARVFRDERDAAVDEARTPSAGLVWWRAQLRTRNEAAVKAGRPIAAVHAIALGTTAAAVAAVAGIAVSGFEGLLSALGSSLSWPWVVLQGAVAGNSVALLPAGVLLILAASALLAPVALYLAVSGD